MKQHIIEEIIQDRTKGMTLIVKTIARMMIALIILFGFYIVLFGHLRPGGGFAGGVILAIAFVLMMISFSRHIALVKLSEFWASLFDNLGMLAFIVIGYVGLGVGYFLHNLIWHGTPFRLISSGIILPCNIAIGFKVGASLYAIFICLSIYGRLAGKEEE